MTRDKTGKNNPNWKGGVHILKCARCASEYVLPRGYRKTTYCSRRCSSVARWLLVWVKPKPTPRLQVHGPYCRLYPARKCSHLTAKGRSFCPGCTNRRRVRIKCVTCGAGVELQPSQIGRITTCSKPCSSRRRAAGQIGALSHLWRGGLTEKTRLERNSAEYAIWRRAVFSRDEFRCVTCGTTGKLTADHIKPWSLFPALRFSVPNGRTLCWPCHRKHGINPGQFTKAEREAWSAESALALLPS